MASEHMFGVVKGRLRAGERERCETIARRHGAWFTFATIPGTGPQGWFSCPNRGYPFDRDVELAVMAEVGEVATVRPRTIKRR